MRVLYFSGCPAARVPGAVSGGAGTPGVTTRLYVRDEFQSNPKDVAFGDGNL